MPTNARPWARSAGDAARRCWRRVARPSSRSRRARETESQNPDRALVRRVALVEAPCALRAAAPDGRFAPRAGDAPEHARRDRALGIRAGRAWAAAAAQHVAGLATRAPRGPDAGRRGA